MKMLGKLLAGLLGLVMIVLLGMFAFGYGQVVQLAWGFAVGGPAGEFDPSKVAPAPDYTLADNWAGLPSRAGLEDYAPPSSPAIDQGSAPVDVFFIHPTGYLAGETWTHDMDPDSTTEENTQWMMANQASAYNGCCNVYAPRYRQANIFAYIRGNREEVLAFAYEDVERAFDYFLEHYSQDRPFIIASHSQGTHHGVKLLQKRIANTPLASRLVAAYLIGGGVKRAEFDALEEINICQSATEVSCVVHWDTYSDSALSDSAPTGNICVNPLNWLDEGGAANAEQHVGALVPSGEYVLKLTGDDAATGVSFQPHVEPIAQHVSAECQNGVLYASDQAGTPFDTDLSSIGGDNYHMLDYPLFYMDIRHNAGQRVAAYLAGPPSAGMSLRRMSMWSRSCAQCHVDGKAGAPRMGVQEEWAARLGQGEASLVDYTINGLNKMPALGYCMACERDDFLAMIKFMTQFTEAEVAEQTGEVNE